MKKCTALLVALSFAAHAAGACLVQAAAEENTADAYVIFSDPIESKNMTFFDGGQDDPYALTYNEKVVLDGEEARKVYGYSPTVNYVYLRMSDSFYKKATDHDFFIDLRFYQFGPGAATFRFQYSSLTGVKTITIRKEAEPMWVTKRLHIADANFDHSIDDVGADIKIVSGAFNAFAFMNVWKASSIRNNSEFEIGAASTDHAERLYDLGLYAPDEENYEKELQTDLTKAKAARMIVKIMGKEDEISEYSTSMTGASVDEGKALGYLEENDYIDWSGDAQATVTQEELVKAFSKIQGIPEDGDLFDNAIEAGLIKPEDLILQPGKTAVVNNLLCLGYNWLIMGDDSGEQNANALVKKNIVEEGAFDKYCYYEKYIDDYTGLPVEYFDMGADGVERMYFTKTYWLRDADAFIVSNLAESRLYKYTLATHKVEALHGAEFKSNDAALTENNLLYIWNQSSSAADRIFYSLDLDEPKYDEITAEVNAGGTAFEGELAFNSTNGEYDKNIGFSGEDGAAQGKTYSYNVPFENGTAGDRSDKWKNSWYFGIPDSFLYGTNPEKVEIEVEYYAPDGSGKLDITVNDDNSRYTAPVVPNEWTTKVFTIKKEDGKYSTFCNGYDGISDFKLMFEDCQAYVHKVSVRKFKYNIKNLGPRPKSAYLIHTTRDGKFVSVNNDHGAEHTFELYDAEKGTWSGELYEGEFVGPGRDTDHVMINPVYSNLILFCHDGVDDKDMDRLWLHDTKTGSYKNVYVQRRNIKNVMTGEKIGHEGWSYDGESIVAVKYRETPNIGRSGIFRCSKYGTYPEYLNDDYDYWHCNPSPDGRWIVADTKTDSLGRGRIVIIDSKTGNSYVVAYPQITWGDPWEPHAQFSSDGKKVTFTTFRRKIKGNNVLGAAIVDVSSIVDNAPPDEVYEGTNGRSGFRISPFKINFAGAGSNEVTTYVENLDENVKKLSLIAAVYDENGRLISAASNGCDTASDTSITTRFDWPEGSKTLKCFMIDGDGRRVKTYPTAVEKLRTARIGMHNVVLSWMPSNNLIESGYEVYKNGVKIGETTDLVYRDANLGDGSLCTYEVRPIFDENAYMTDDDAFVTVTPVYVNGKLTAEHKNNVSAPKAQVQVKTDDETISCNLGTDTENGLSFCPRNAENVLDNYNEKTVVDGVACRKNIVQTVGDVKKTGMFYFRTDKNIISRRVKDVDITVRYYNYVPGGGDIYLDYNANNKNNNTVVLASVSDSPLLRGWKTATVRLSDVAFDNYQNLSRCDFRLRPTCEGVCISEVSVTNNDEESTSNDQYVQWNTKEQSGLTLKGGGREENDCRYIESSDEWLKFDVDNTYQYGADMNMAWVDISYLDIGTDEIYFEYNTSDPTATAEQKPHKPAEVIKCTNTGEIKTKRISLIDVAFSGLDGYDFRIGTNNKAYISNVRLLGY